VKAGALFVAATTLLILVAYMLLRLGFSSPVDARAMRVSAAVALVVQVLTFAIARRSSHQSVIIGWGVGALLRFLALVLYAALVAPALGLQLSAALVSLFVFLFTSMLVEPFLLAYDR
jgi:hypothetical protein